MPPPRWPPYSPPRTQDFWSAIVQVLWDNRLRQVAHVEFLLRIFHAKDELVRLGERGAFSGIWEDFLIQTRGRTAGSYVLKPFNDPMAQAVRAC
ncbi:MAG: hypothetical protein B7Y80_08870 [Hyphomicrobium sp. 32-62-53]|nr:MAG: hypothetical protein B7Y80_08870 [Hyphomicrobium sp. 32-62-53]